MISWQFKNEKLMSLARLCNIYIYLDGLLQQSTKPTICATTNYQMPIGFIKLKKSFKGHTLSEQILAELVFGCFFVIVFQNTSYNEKFMHIIISKSRYIFSTRSIPATGNEPPS